MLEGIFGNQTTEKILLSLVHYGETYVAAVAKDFKTAENPIRNQLDQLEETGVIISRKAGRTRIYTFNPKNPYTSHVRGIAETFYKGIPLKEREKLFAHRKPRRKGKPVL